MSFLSHLKDAFSNAFGLDKQAIHDAIEKTEAEIMTAVVAPLERRIAAIETELGIGATAPVAAAPTTSTEAPVPDAPLASSS